MLKASEVLKLCGWVPVKKGVHPQETKWIDPLAGPNDKKEYFFGEACQIQEARGEPKDV